MSTTLRGYVPILATPFDADEEVDEPSLRRLIDHLVAREADGLVTLANASEGYLLSGDERRRVADVVLDQVAGRVPVVVSITTFSAKVAADEARRAEKAGAAAVLSMPPFYGQWRTDRPGMREFFATVADRTTLPIVLQDHALSGYTLTADDLVALAEAVPRVAYFKIEYTNTPLKTRRLIEGLGDRLAGVFGGWSGILLLEELASGACGTMPACYLPRVFTRVLKLHQMGEAGAARQLFRRYLPLLNFELYLGGRDLVKEILFRQGLITSPATRKPGAAAWPRMVSLLDTLLAEYDLTEF
jgi:4-hydroxy-tetrahydrodipicolinate synthase